MPPINPSIRVIGPYMTDERALYWTGTVWRPYADVTEANATIDADRRVIGLMVRLNAGWYEYKAGIGDGDLVPFTGTAGTTGFSKLAIKCDGLPGSPVDGSYVFTSSLLVGATVLDILVNKIPETLIDNDFSFDAGLGRITRVNKWFTDDTAIINFGI